MSALDHQVAAILADPLAQARDADRAIGFVGLEVPDDLLAASGRFAVHLPWSIDRSTPRADGWLESSFPVAARSILEDWAEGRFDFLEAVMFTRGEDSTQRLYYYVCELQRRGIIGGPEPLIFDVAKVPRPSSFGRTRESLVRLADRFGVDDEALREGIAATDRRRRWFADVTANRTGPGSRYERIARAGLFAPLDHLDPGPPLASIPTDRASCSQARRRPTSGCTWRSRRRAPTSLPNSMIARWSGSAIRLAPTATPSICWPNAPIRPGSDRAASSTAPTGWSSAPGRRVPTR
jgi:hypothetical protein